ncbi:hypothetical protein BDA96_03G034400 [Sorghum bicolor]|uniref:Uncharacterized protein n=2 Tax=Sorghum bicolor TaxID=4558 RepID=A0A921QGP5_SORBI|nr:hypothetical protein BDA96_08G186600 [Sorghum bicolor]KAG0536086.1 hypothetical protein BDA96_03G034400 [Sorghum bicolor]KXG31617.1 hypothetical protein SORBI_3003G031300 [Sorghum bicolor]KXG39327.1 hypothetical protein SORBI_3001G365400 [Sorghum bicolor]
MAALLDPPLPVPILKVLAATGTTRTATAVAPAVGGPGTAWRRRCAVGGHGCPLPGFPLPTLARAGAGVLHR